MYESALRDGLTKAFNKKYFTDRLESEFTFAIRHAAPLTLVLFDIDHFKKVNDTHGHPAGDFVLAELSTLLTGSLRAEDVFARYGGEEFAVICRGSELAQGQIVGERLRKAVEAHRFVYEGTHIPITISVGVAGLPDAQVKDAAELVGAADQALYKSKGEGRNRITVHRAAAPRLP
jgi:diguanylate cyclase (GGDEF)-like protein